MEAGFQKLAIFLKHDSSFFFHIILNLKFPLGNLSKMLIFPFLT